MITRKCVWDEIQNATIVMRPKLVHICLRQCLRLYKKTFQNSRYGQRNGYQNAIPNVLPMRKEYDGPFYIL